MRQFCRVTLNYGTFFAKMSFKCWKNETFAWRADRAVKWQLSLSVQDNFRQIKRCKISTEKMRGIYPLNSFNLAGIVVFTGFLNAGGFACLFILMSSCITLCCFCCIYCRNPKIHNWLKTSMKKCFLFSGWDPVLILNVILFNNFNAI